MFLKNIIHDNVFFIIDDKDHLCKKYVTSGKKKINNKLFSTKMNNSIIY
jgi:hypothetical protein